MQSFRLVFLKKSLLCKSCGIERKPTVSFPLFIFRGMFGKHLCFALFDDKVKVGNAHRKLLALHSCTDIYIGLLADRSFFCIQRMQNGKVDSSKFP